MRSVSFISLAADIPFFPLQYLDVAYTKVIGAHLHLHGLKIVIFLNVRNSTNLLYVQQSLQDMAFVNIFADR